MKRLFLVLVLLLSASLPAQAPEPVPLAHGNTPGEPHHHLKIENEYVRVYYVEVPPHESTQLHQHDHDYLFVTLGDSDVINAVRDKPEVHLVLKNGETHFTRGGFAHVARNVADTPFRNITIELLKPQGEPHNLCGPVILGDPLQCNEVNGYHGEGSQFETTECKVDMVQLGPGMVLRAYANTLAFLMVSLSNSRIRVTAKGNPPKTIGKGEMVWVDAATDMRFANAGSIGAAVLQVTFKDVAPPSNH